MKVYERNEKNNYRYPDEMEKILNYLNGCGKILVKDSTIENLYYEFCDERYDAGWLGVNKEILEDFENWLNEYEF